MYMCDICSDTFPKPEGTFYDQNRVLTSPGYWEIVFAKPAFVEGILGMQLAMFCQDTSGFTVCDKCADVLEGDDARAAEYGLAEHVTSIPSGRVDSHAAGMVAGTVWKQLNGSWPETIQIGGSDNPAGELLSREKAPRERSSPAPAATNADPEQEGSSGCFVATVAYGGANTLEVQALRAFRDQRLSRSATGRCLIRVYYRWGPGLARIVQRSSILRRGVRFALGGLARRSMRLKHPHAIGPGVGVGVWTQDPNAPGRLLKK